MNVNMYVYERKKCTLTSKRTLEHDCKNKTFIAKCLEHKCDRIYFCELITRFARFAEIRTYAVFSVILFIFIEFEWPGLRSLDFTSCTTLNNGFSSQIPLLSSLFETGL